MDLYRQTLIRFPESSLNTTVTIKYAKLTPNQFREIFPKDAQMVEVKFSKFISLKKMFVFSRQKKNYTETFTFSNRMIFNSINIFNFKFHWKNSMGKKRISIYFDLNHIKIFIRHYRIHSITTIVYSIFNRILLESIFLVKNISL